MVRKNYNNQSGGNQGKSRREQQKPEHQTQSRANNQSYSQNRRSQNQARQPGGVQNNGAHVSSNKEATAQSQNTGRNTSAQGGQGLGQGRRQPYQRNSYRGAKTNEQQTGEGAQTKGYYRDRAKSSERDKPPRHYPAASAGRYGSNQRNKGEETIDDIKRDIVRLEKEIELEIKEIRSLKL